MHKTQTYKVETKSDKKEGHIEKHEKERQHNRTSWKTPNMPIQIPCASALHTAVVSWVCNALCRTYSPEKNRWPASLPSQSRQPDPVLPPPEPETEMSKTVRRRRSGNGSITPAQKKSEHMSMHVH